MEKNIMTKVGEISKLFLVSLENVENEIVSKLKEYEKLADETTKLNASLKLQEKENDKRLEAIKARLDDEFKKQASVSKQVDAELAKQTKITAEIQANKDKSEEELKIIHQAKNEALKDVESRKKLIQELKDKVIEVEKLKDTTIKKAKENETEYQKLLMKEAELNGIKNKLEKDKLEFDGKQANLDLRVKNIEHIERQQKVRNG